SRIRSAIMYGGYPNANSSPSIISTVSSGATLHDDLEGDPGNRGQNIFEALSARAAQDTDNLSPTWLAYQALGRGNNRRIVTVPIASTWSGNGANAQTDVIGFANFLLDASYSGTSGP